MKTRLFLLAVSLFVPTTLLLAQEPAPGRYVLLAGTATVNDHDEKLILKVDTATGQTWKYVVLPLKPGDMSTVAEGWTSLDNDASETWMKLHQADASKQQPKRRP